MQNTNKKFLLIKQKKIYNMYIQKDDILFTIFAFKFTSNAAGEGWYTW